MHQQSKPEISGLKSIWISPSATEGFSLIQYGLKAVIKIAVGLVLHSGVFLSEGIHGFTDLLQSCLVLVSMKVEARQRDGYAYGFRELAPILSSVIGIMLGLTAFGLMTRSALGLIASFWPWMDWAVHQTWFKELPLIVPQTILADGHLAVWLLGFSIASFGLSRFTGWRQVTVGKLTGHAQLADDGKETLADSSVDLVVIASVVTAQFMGLKWPEFFFGLVASVIMLRTAWEIAIPGVQCLLKKSLGAVVEQNLVDQAVAVCGVRTARVRKTYRIGSLARADVEIVSELPASAHQALRKAVKKRVKAALINPTLGIRAAEALIIVVLPERDCKRIAYLIQETTEGWMICSSILATHICLCDLEYSAMVKSEIFQIRGLSKPLPDWLLHKRVDILRGRGNVMLHAGIEVQFAASAHLTTYGISGK